MFLLRVFHNIYVVVIDSDNFRRFLFLLMFVLKRRFHKFIKDFPLVQDRNRRECFHGDALEFFVDLVVFFIAITESGEATMDN